MGHMRFAPDEDIRLLYARLEDLCIIAARGESAMTDFLTPREAKYAREALESRVREGTALLWGGYPDAERVRAILLPDYMTGLVAPDVLAVAPVETLVGCGLDDLADMIRNAVIPLQITGSGYRVLSHRDYLGSVLGLGLERDAVGDISVEDDRSACMLCKGELTAFLLENLTKVSTDTVKTVRRDEPVASRCRFQLITDTVASERLDCVVAALVNLSRDKAQTVVRQGLVEMDYEVVERCDAAVEPPCVVSVRGVGKFAVRTFDGSTRKGRLRLIAEKYL